MPLLCELVTKVDDWPRHELCWVLNNVNFRPNHVELWHFRCYFLCRGVLATFRQMLHTKTGLQFCELVTKILREQTTEWNYFRTAEDKTIRQGTCCSNRTIEHAAVVTELACNPDSSSGSRRSPLSPQGSKRESSLIWTVQTLTRSSTRRDPIFLKLWRAFCTDTMLLRFTPSVCGFSNIHSDATVTKYLNTKNAPIFPATDLDSWFI